MLRVYLSYGGNDGPDAALRAAGEMAALGYNPFVPMPFHRSTPPEVRGGSGSANGRRCSLEWLERCDAILLLPGWSQCEEGLEEMEHAEDSGLPIFTSLETLMRRFPSDVRHSDYGLSEIIVDAQLICD